MAAAARFGFRENFREKVLKGLTEPDRQEQNRSRGRCKRAANSIARISKAWGSVPGCERMRWPRCRKPRDTCACHPNPSLPLRCTIARIRACLRLGYTRFGLRRDLTYTYGLPIWARSARAAGQSRRRCSGHHEVDLILGPGVTLENGRLRFDRRRFPRSPAGSQREGSGGLFLGVTRER